MPRGPEAATFTEAVWHSGWGWDYWEVMVLDMGFTAGFLTTLPTMDMLLPLDLLVMAMADSPLTVMGTHPLIRRLLRYLLPRLSSSSSRRSYSLRRPRRFPPPQPTTGIIAASLTAIIPTSKIALAAGCKWRL